MSISAVKEKSKQKTPASFPVRRMDYEFQDMPKYWCNDEPTFTHYFTGLSTLFPEGESYFVRSVRALRGRIKNNPQLDRDIGAFIGQEAMHSKEHHAFHVSAQQYGLDPESLEKATGIILKAVERAFPKKWNLLVTVGLEHYTAVLVVEMMKNVNELMTDTTIRNLWLWHSVEETEHKAVAYDMYEYLYGKGLDAYIPRVAIFTFSLVLITLFSNVYQVVLMSRDKQLLNLKSWTKFAGFTVQAYRKLVPQFFSYYQFDFHPNDTDESEIVAQTKVKIGLSPEQSTPSPISILFIKIGNSDESTHMTGLEIMQAFQKGLVPAPGIAKTMGMEEVGDVEYGRIVFMAIADERHSNPLGGVHGGFAATILDSVTGCATHTVLAVGEGYGTTDLTIKMCRPMPLIKS